jgi:predicted permease
VYGAMFDEGPVLKRLFSDVDFLNRELLRVFRSSLPEFYFAVLALVVAFYGSGMFLRLSRWHLLNITLALLALRGLLALFCLLGEGVVFELGKDMSNPQALKFLPEVVLFVVGGLLVLIDLLFVPFKRKEGV